MSWSFVHFAGKNGDFYVKENKSSKQEPKSKKTIAASSDAFTAINTTYHLFLWSINGSAYGISELYTIQ